MKVRAIVLVLTTIVVGCFMGSATAFQRSTGMQSVSGMVVDTNGRPVPNVKVVLTSVNKESDRTSKTEKSGYFHFDFAPQVNPRSEGMIQVMSREVWISRCPLTQNRPTVLR